MVQFWCIFLEPKNKKKPLWVYSEGLFKIISAVSEGFVNEVQSRAGTLV